MENYEANIATGLKTDVSAADDELNAYESYFASQSSNLSNVLRDFYITILLSKNNAASQTNLKTYPTSGLNFITDLTDISPNNLTFKHSCTGRKTGDPNGISYYLNNSYTGSKQPIYFSGTTNGLNFTVSGGTVSNGTTQFHNVLQESYHGGLYRMGVNYHEARLAGKIEFAVNAKAEATTCTHTAGSNEFNLLLVREALNVSNNNLTQLQITRSNSTVKNIGTIASNSNISECLNNVSDIKCFSRTTAITYYNKPDFSVMNCPINYTTQLRTEPFIITPLWEALSQKIRSGSTYIDCNAFVAHNKTDTDLLIDTEPIKNTEPAKLFIFNMLGVVVAETSVESEHDAYYYINEFRSNQLPRGIYIAAMFDEQGQAVNSLKFFKY